MKYISMVVFFIFMITSASVFADQECPFLNRNAYAICQDGTWHFGINSQPASWQVTNNHINGASCKVEGEQRSEVQWTFANYVNGQLSCNYEIEASPDPGIIGWFSLTSPNYTYIAHDGNGFSEWIYDNGDGVWSCCFQGSCSMNACPIKNK